MFALVDCDNFYVSCERVFNPRLRGRPVVVLSNNDGCIISRSEEAKALGIRMGAPLFQVRDLVERCRVEVFSSNYALYGDMSRRVMETLRELTPEVEVYSIDEAFMNLAGERPDGLDELGRRTRATVKRWTGIDTSVGIAATKTLAKLASHLAKKSSGAGGVVNLSGTRGLEAALARVDVAEVWGIGPNRARVLKAAGITNALELRAADERWIRRRMGVAGQRIVYELRGTSCLPIELCPPPKRSVTVSRSFGSPVETLKEMREAVALYVSRAAEKLRRQDLAARVLVVYLATNRFGESQRYSASVVVNLPAPTNLTPELIKHAQKGVEQLFRPGLRYKKAGVTLVELAPARPMQAGLCDERDYERARRLMRVIDFVNARMGAGTLRYAATGFKQRWLTRLAQRSARCTTEWKELLLLSELPDEKLAL